MVACTIVHRLHTLQVLLDQLRVVGRGTSHASVGVVGGGVDVGAIDDKHTCCVAHIVEPLGLRIVGAECVVTTLAQLLNLDAQGRSDLAEDYVLETFMPGISLVPASIELINADFAAAIRFGGVSIKAISDLLYNLNMDAWIDAGVPNGGANAFDHVLIDCPPSFTAASVAALYAADDVIIPLEADLFSVIGLTTLMKQVESVRRFKPNIRIAGALITKWHNTPACIQGECALRASAVPVFRQVIRRSDKVTESIGAGQALQAYSPQSAAGRDYRAFVDEFLEVAK